MMFFNAIKKRVLHRLLISRDFLRKKSNTTPSMKKKKKVSKEPLQMPPEKEGDEDYATVISVINEPGLESGGDETLFLSKNQIMEFCTQDARGMKILDEHDDTKKIGEAIRLFEKDGWFISEQKIKDKESIEKLLNGTYVGSSIGMHSLKFNGEKPKILAKAIHEISLTEEPDRKDAQIIQIKYKDKVYNRKWDDDAGFLAFDDMKKALYGKGNFFFFFIFPSFVIVSCHHFFP